MARYGNHIQKAELSVDVNGNCTVPRLPCPLEAVLETGAGKYHRELPSTHVEQL